VFLDPRSVLLQRSAKGLPVLEPQTAGELQARHLVGWKLMGLLVRRFLQAVFDHAQERVSFAQLPARQGREVPPRSQDMEHLQEPLLSKLRHPTPADQLEDLRRELDLPDASGA
jgi:hypothetical protein